MILVKGSYVTLIPQYLTSDCLLALAQPLQHSTNHPDDAWTLTPSGRVISSSLLPKTLHVLSFFFFRLRLQFLVSRGFSFLSLYFQYLIQIVTVFLLIWPSTHLCPALFQKGFKLSQYLVNKRHSINICKWMNEWMFLKHWELLHTRWEQMMDWDHRNQTNGLLGTETGRKNVVLALL